MTVLRHALCPALWISSAGVAAALPVTPSERAEVFAKCSGNLSALASYEATGGKAPNTRTLALRDGFDALLEATLPDAVDYGMPKAQAANWKFNAWLTQAELLNDVAYSIDEKRADRAWNTVRSRLAICEDILLSGG